MTFLGGVLGLLPVLFLVEKPQKTTLKKSYRSYFSRPLKTLVCPWDKPGFAGLPLCKIRRKPGFVPGFHRICPRDKPGEIPGTNPGSSQDQPDKKVYVYVPFSCLTQDLLDTKIVSRNYE